ncbi:hypothetical protein L596_015411 [Steinernema carpocapsae]|uniref:Neurochondrin n=1 Tax=Steinernema carpocapsae TaxID=34508 RepID=A0A4U5NFW5_STECR|nr:hypothetical protein L596_015411 [Steinernema carpocapsae]
MTSLPSSDLNELVTLLISQSQEKEKKNKLPDMDYLYQVLDNLEFLRFGKNILDPEGKAAQKTYPWMAGLHKVVMGILRTKYLTPEYTDISLEIANAASLIVGKAWFNEDKKVLPLFAGLVAVQLRLVLQDEENVDAGKVDCCASLMKSLIDMAEDDDDLDDDIAGMMGAQIHEGLTFLIETLLKAEAQLNPEAKRPLFLIISFYLMTGAHAIFEREKMIYVKRCLKHIYEQAPEKEGMKELMEEIEETLP